MKKRRIKRCIAIILAFTMAMIPLQGQGVTVRAAESLTANASAQLTSLAELDTVMTEELSMREESVKVYNIGSNGYLAAVYNDPVHYLDEDGQWQEIDNRLTPATTATTAATVSGSSVPYFQNTANKLSVRFPTTLTTTTPLQITIDDFTLGMALQGAAQQTKTAQTGETASLQTRILPQLQPLEQSAAASMAQLQAQPTQTERLAAVNARLAAETDAEARLEILRDAKMELPNQKAVVDYEEVLPGVTLQYVLHSDQLKENLILSQTPGQTSYTFALTFSGHTAQLLEDGTVCFYKAGEEDGKPAACIPAPYMYDALDEMCFDITVELESTATGALYRITPDAEWLNDPARQYPVTIDPAVLDDLTTSQLATDIIDNGVVESNPTTVYHTTDRFYVGSHVSGGTAYSSWVYIQLPRISSIGTGDFVSKAELTLSHYPTASFQTAVNNTYQIYSTGSWISTGLCWNNKPSPLGSPQASFISHTKNQTLDNDIADITKLARTWYASSSAACRFVIKPASVDTSATNRTCYYSSDCSASLSAKRPQMRVYFYKGSPATGISTTQKYFIRNYNSNKFLEVSSTDADATSVVQKEYHGDTSQRWELQYRGGGVYSFIPQHNTNLRLHIPNKSSAAGTTVRVQSIYDDERQHFQITANGDGTYRITPMCGTSMSLSVRNASTADNAVIELQTSSTAAKMKWCFDEVNFGGAYSYTSIATSSTNVNCAGFALRINEDVQANINAWDSVINVADKLIDYFDNKGLNRSIRLIDGVNIPPTYSIDSDEYRVALRVVTNKTGNPDADGYDFHLMLQTADGRWAHKQGDFSSESLGYYNPSNDEWDLPRENTGTKIYDSDVLYFAVSR